jgi:hypothetical protein
LRIHSVALEILALTLGMDGAAAATSSTQRKLSFRFLQLFRKTG